MKHIFLLSCAALTLLNSCKKNEPALYDNSVKAPLSVEFDNIVGSSDLQLNTGVYTNAAGENFSVTKLKYYVSNFKLTNIDGSIYTIPQDSSYFLINEGSADDVKLNVPEGEYTSITFTIGVDSLRNTMDISKRTGVLDPATDAADLYWGWNSGYIFFRLDGTSPAVTMADHVFNYHVGGFGGYSSPTPNNLRNVTLDLSARGTPKVKVGKSTNIHLMVDLLKMLSGSTTMSFATTPMIHSAAGAIPVANNYTAMFRHDHTEN